MTTIRDKLEVFHKLIYEGEEEKYKKILKELEEKKQFLIESKKLEIEKRREEALRKKNLLEEAEKNRIISEKTQEMKSRFLSKRNDILEDLIASLEEKANSFTSTAEYVDIVTRDISKVIENLGEKELIITITEEDEKKLSDSILKMGKKYNKNITINTVKKSRLIGGFVITDRDRTYSIDNSYKSIIEENRYKIGKRLYDAIEKAGDIQWKI